MPYLERTRGGWRVAWRNGGRGSKIQKGKTYQTKADATAALRGVAAELDASRPLTMGEPLTWAQVVTRYCAARAKRTKPAHRSDLRLAALALAKRHSWTMAADVQPSQTAALGPLHARYMRALLRFAGDECGQRINRIALAKCRSRSPRRKAEGLLTAEQVAALQSWADKASPGDGMIVHLISTYGHRAESLVYLGRAAWDGETLTLPIKSGDMHAHPVLPATAARLAALPGGGPPFLSHLGKAWPSGKDFACWMRHGHGVGVLPLRRYAVTRLLDVCQGDARTVASITGHRTPSLLLNVYARTSETRQRTALAGLAAGSTVVAPAATASNAATVDIEKTQEKQS